jgi:parallel beta-helix repeat protein
MATAIWSRINTFLLIIVLLALATLIAMLAAGVRGGPLDPPGAPGSTDSVKLPGTPINDLPYLITDPGNYYVTRNLNAEAGSDGITIRADDVTLDLRGFTLNNAVGFGTSGNGIRVEAPVPSDPLRHITIRNGVVRDWDLNGVYAPKAIFSRFEDLTVSGNFGDGLIAGSANIIERVIAHHNTHGFLLLQVGPWAGGHLTDSLASHNGADGLVLSASQVIVEGNTFNSNGQSLPGSGIYVDGHDNIIRNNEADWNDNGIYVAPGDLDNEFTRNHAENNTITDCVDTTLVAAPGPPPPNDWGYPFDRIGPFQADVIYYSQVFGNVCVTVASN